MNNSQIQSTPANYVQWRQRRQIQLLAVTHTLYRAVPLSPSCIVQAPLYKCYCGYRESILVSIYTSEHRLVLCYAPPHDIMLRK